MIEILHISKMAWSFSLYRHEVYRWISLHLFFIPSCMPVFHALQDCRPCLWCWACSWRIRTTITCCRMNGMKHYFIWVDNADNIICCFIDLVPHMKFLLLFDTFVYFILLPPIVHYQQTTDTSYFTYRMDTELNHSTVPLHLYENVCASAYYLTVAVR